MFVIVVILIAIIVIGVKLIYPILTSPYACFSEEECTQKIDSIKDSLIDCWEKSDDLCKFVGDCPDLDSKQKECILIEPELGVCVYNNC